jgi:hypothetical protein
MDYGMSPNTQIVIASSSWGMVCRALRSLKGETFNWLYLGHSVTTRIRVERLVGDAGEKVSFSQYLQSAMTGLRQPYIDYVGQLSQVHSSPEWWAGIVSEKNPLSSRLLLNACYIQACLDLLKDRGSDLGPVLVIADGRLLRSALTANLRNQGHHPKGFESRTGRWSEPFGLISRLLLYKGYFVLSELSRIFQARFLRRAHRAKILRSVLQRGKPLTLIHTWVDFRSFNPRTGEINDPDFSEVAKYLKGSGEEVVRLPYIQRVLPYGRTVGVMARGEEPYLIPHAFLSPWDVLRTALSTSLAVPKERAYPPLMGLEVSDLVLDDQRRQWYRHDMPKNLLFHHMVRQWKARGLNVGKVIYPFENHAWERVLCMAMARFYPEAKLVAFQPARVPMFLTNYFIAESEQDLTPLPNRIVTNGAYTARLLRPAYGDGLVVEGGSLRHQYLFNGNGGGEGPLARGKRPFVILATPSIGNDEALELVWKVYQAFKDLPEFNVIIKCHPSRSFSRLAKALGLPPLPQHFSVSTLPLKDLLATSHLVVYTSSTTSVEAVAYGLPLLHVRLDHDFDMDPLEFSPHLRKSVSLPEELVEGVRQALDPAREARGEQYHLGRAVVDDMFGPVTEDTFKLFAL